MNVSPDRAFDTTDLDADPLVLFARWFGEACDAEAFQPEAMALATATPAGAPSLRMVLNKGFDELGLVFFSNYGSRKGAELDANPQAALLFHWPELGRQVRIEGPVSRLSREESEGYARSRPRASQLSALASPQSRPVPSRDWLERKVKTLAGRYEHAELPVNEEWGGYRVVAQAWEFWQHRNDRLHDRFRYRPQEGGGWVVERLGP